MPACMQEAIQRGEYSELGDVAIYRVSLGLPTYLLIVIIVVAATLAIIFAVLVIAVSLCR